MERGRDGERERWREGEMERGRDGERERQRERYTHTPMCNFSAKSGPEFSYTLYWCEVLTKSGLSFMHKMSQEIISMPRWTQATP